MEAGFWHERWQQNQIGFHQGEVNAYLCEYWPALKLQAAARVLVPLCGKSLDLVWLAQQGYQVEGIELSPLAVEAFFDEQGLTPQKTRHNGFEVWATNGLRLWCGDFFNFAPDLLPGIDAVYDRAALIAMPPSMREAYVQHIHKLARTAPQLLVTLEYPQSQMQGPPFSVLEADVARLYAACYEGSRPVARKDILIDEPRFRERGLDVLNECVYLLQPRQK